MRRLLLCTSFGLALAAPAVAAASGGPVPPQQGGAGVSTPTHDATFIAAGVGHRTVIERFADGTLRRWRTLPGSYGVPGVGYDGSMTGVSADGSTLVLAHTVRSYPVQRTPLVVLDARRLRVRARITLPGWYVVDGISPDGRWLYLIHYTSRRDATRYEVRAYDLPARRMARKPIVDPREPDEAMRGFPMTRAVSADGRWDYTLYLRPSAAPFIHALDTARRTARCIDLPAGLAGNAGNARLSVTDGGATLVVRERGSAVAMVDTRTWKVRPPGAAPAPRLRKAVPAAAHASAGGGASPWPFVAAGLAALAGIAAGVALRRGRRTSTPA
jgi:hypothetical protein